MAIKSLPVQRIGEAGTNPTYYDSATTPALAIGTLGNTPTGDQFTVQNDGRLWVEVRNGATAVNVTFERPTVVFGDKLADRVRNVPANQTRRFGPFDRREYGDVVKFALDSVANVRVAVLGLP